MIATKRLLAQAGLFVALACASRNAQAQFPHGRLASADPVFFDASGPSFAMPAAPQFGSPPVSRRLYNGSVEGPDSPPCGLVDYRGGPVPPRNPGTSRQQPPGVGVNDPWRPPHSWPQTRYPVVPAYAQPNYGYYETTWRQIPVAVTGPSMALNRFATPTPATEPQLQSPPAAPQPGQQRPSPEAPPAEEKGLKTAPQSPELRPAPVIGPVPESSPPTSPSPPSPKDESPAGGATLPPPRAAMADPDASDENAEITTRPF